jgi:hypothetical protein
MKLIVLIVLIIAGKSSLAGTKLAPVLNQNIMTCQSINSLKNTICGDSSAKNKNSNYELTHYLVDTLDSKGYDYDLTTVFKNVKISNCLNSKMVQKKIACIKKSDAKSTEKENVAYVEDLF